TPTAAPRRREDDGRHEAPPAARVAVALEEPARAERFLQEDDRDHAEDAEETDEADQRRPSAFALGAARPRRGLGLDPLEDAGHGRFEPGRVLSLPEAGRDPLPDDFSRHHVGDGRLEPVADLDPNLSILDEHEQDQSVVETLLADPPLL